MRKTIAIIENQQTQFLGIRHLFPEADYSVIPSIDEYNSFIDAVKIYLNPRYLEKARRKAFDEIIDNIKSADILVIDHRLCGNSKGQDGIDLAEAILLNRRKAKISLPLVIFYSRSPSGVEAVKTRLQQFENALKDYKRYTNWDWIEKGYVDVYGDETKYFQKWVIENGIKKMLSHKEQPNKTEELVQNIKNCFINISHCIPGNAPDVDRTVLSKTIKTILEKIDNMDIDALSLLHRALINDPINKGVGNKTDLKNLIRKLNEFLHE